MADERNRNRALLIYVLLPTIFLTVALLGGVRVTARTNALVFAPPPLITLILATLLFVLFTRGGAIIIGRWLSADNAVLANLSHALTLGTLFFASAQAFNSVLPESGLLRWVFSFFFLWTLWQNLFAPFDARRLLRSLAVLFGTAFALKHLLLASLFAPEAGWLRRLVGFAVEGITLGALAGEPHAPATGYLSFFTLALYVLGLFMLPPAPDLTAPQREGVSTNDVAERIRRLPPAERANIRRALEADADEETIVVERRREELRRED